MAFKPGISGNPSGRPRKPKAGPDKLRQDLLREAPEILAKLVELAKTGDVPAAKEVLGRCLPALRPTDRPVSLALGDDLGAAGKAVLASLAAGTLTPDQASSIAGTIGTLARSAELTEFSARLTAIEASINERRTRDANS
jgi:hypothetical protein